jgi:hypothetical protein
MSTGSQLTVASLRVDEARRVEVEEQRLFLAVIIGLAGRQLAAPVEREADPLQLPRIAAILARVQPPGWTPFSIAAFSAGMPKASQPIGWRTSMPLHPLDSARARRPSYSCGHGPYGCAPTDRGTSPAHRPSGLGLSSRSWRKLCAGSPRHACQRASAFRVETRARGSFRFSCLSGANPRRPLLVGAAAQVAGAGQDDVFELLHRRRLDRSVDPGAALTAPGAMPRRGRRRRAGRNRGSTRSASSARPAELGFAYQSVTIDAAVRIGLQQRHEAQRRRATRATDRC